MTTNLQPATVGQTFFLFGRRYDVITIEPHSDWVWYVEATDRDNEVARFYLPSEVRIAG